MVRKFFRLFAAFFIVPLVSLSLFSCGGGSGGPGSEAGSGPLRIAYLPITHSLPLLAASSLDSSGRVVEPVRFGSWTELVEALAAGRVDGAVELAPLALRAFSAGVPLRVEALGHRCGNVVVAAVNIASAVDLRGKVVAIPHRLSSHYILLELLLHKAGLSLSDVRVTELPPPEMPAALLSGSISAYIVAEPFGAKGVVSGAGHVLASSEDLWPGSVCCFLALRSDVADADTARVSAFARLYRLAGRRLASDSAFAGEVARGALNIDDAVLRKSLEWIRFDGLQVRKEDYDVLSSQLFSNGLLSVVPSFSSLVSTDFLNH